MIGGAFMNLRRRVRVAMVVLTVLAAVCVLCLFAGREAGRAAQPEDVAALPALADATVLRYREGAAQLSAIQTQAIPASPLASTDVLSARLVYDEDSTARIGVGIGGRIVAVKAAPGDVVKAGQVLAQIDSADVGTACADLSKAQADESRKRAALARARDLVPGEAIAVKDVEALQADLAQAQAETARAEQRLNNLNPQHLAISGQRLSLASPIAGVVTERTATPALEVGAAPTVPLFVVTDPARLWLMIDLPEQMLGRAKTGGRVEVESDAFPGVRFTAKIAQRGLLVDPNTRRVTLRARLDNADLKLLPEMFVRARLLQDVGSGVRLPNSALVNEGRNTYVFVQSAVGQFVRRQVTLLTQGGDASYVGEGLKGGERVVTGGALLLDAELAARLGTAP